MPDPETLEQFESEPLDFSHGEEVDEHLALVPQQPDTRNVEAATSSVERIKIKPSDEHLSELPTNQLARLAQDGNLAAQNHLFKRCESMAKSIIFKEGFFYPRASADLDDLAQVALIGAMEAFDGHDPSRGSFSNLAHIAMRRQMIDSIQSTIRIKRGGGEIEISLDATPKSIDQGSVRSNDPGILELYDLVDNEDMNVDEQVFQDEFFKEAFEVILPSLSEKERVSLLGFLQGYSYKELAEITGWDDKTIDNGIWRARQKLKHLKELI